MIKRLKHYTQIASIVVAASIFLTGCISKPYMVKPVDGYVGNISVNNITVSKTAEVQSDTVVAALEKQLKSDSADLHGAKKVDITVELDYLTVPLPGGDTTSKLIGSNTILKGTVVILDAGKVVAKYKITADHSEGGLLSKTMTISFVDTTNAVIKKFSEFTVSYMQ